MSPIFLYFSFSMLIAHVADVASKREVADYSEGPGLTTLNGVDVLNYCHFFKFFKEKKNLPVRLITDKNRLSQNSKDNSDCKLKESVLGQLPEFGVDLAYSNHICLSCTSPDPYAQSVDVF